MNIIKKITEFSNMVQEINIEDCTQEEFQTVVEYMKKHFIDNLEVA